MMYENVLFIPGGPFEIALILIALIVLFGPNKIPEVASALGQSLGKFEEGKRKAREELESTEDETYEEETETEQN
jgi:TatA/E family protein of Tat protein translocase